MEFKIETLTDPLPITIIQPQGDLDGTTYTDLIDRVKENIETGAQYFILDMSGISYMSSAGLVALQSIAQLVRGDAGVDVDAGWRAIRSVGADAKEGHKGFLKLLNLTSQVSKALDMVGLFGYFEIFTDRDEAIASFTA